MCFQLTLCLLQTPLWQTSPWTSCVCWWRTSGAGCARRTSRKPSDSSLVPSLRGRSWMESLHSDTGKTDSSWSLTGIILSQMAGGGSCPPHQRPLLGDLSSSAAGGCVAWRNTACPTPGRAQCIGERGHQEAVSELSDEADSRWVAPQSDNRVWKVGKWNLLLEQIWICIYAYVYAELITDLLGSEKYRLSLEMMLESLQDHQINKWVKIRFRGKKCLEDISF